MKILKDRIIQDGVIEKDILKVDNFLNHQIDVELLNEIGKEFKTRFKDQKIDKILTIETSGIAIAVIAAQYFKVPVVFARKTDSKTMDKEVYESIDDFLARGKAMEGLIDILDRANANLAGVGIVIEKGFQDGGKNLRDRGVILESLAIIDKPIDGKIKFI